MMKLAEDFLSGVVLAVCGSYKITYHPQDDPENPNKSYEIDFTPPFRRVSMMSGLQAKMNELFPELKIQFPSNKELHTEEARKFFDDLCKSRGVDCAPPRSAARLIDKLVAEYLEVDCTNPCFIIEQPQIMSPLAKWHRDMPGLTERFELFVNRHELMNGYTELNDPKVQMEAF